MAFRRLREAPREFPEHGIARVMAEDSPVFPRYDEAEDPAWERWRSLTAQQVWAALEERRTALVSAVSALAPPQLARTGVHQKFGPMTVPRWLPPCAASVSLGLIGVELFG